MQSDLPPTRVSVKIEEFPDDDERLNQTQNPSIDNHLLYHIHDPVPDLPQPSPTSSSRLTPKSLPHEIILTRLKAASASRFKTNAILQSWVPKPRWNEIDDGLLKDLMCLDSEHALSILTELKEPRHMISKINHKSVEIPLSLQTLDDLRSFSADALLDSGATGCYINKSFAEELQLNTTPLPRKIPVYNADNSINRAGSITATAELFVHIHNHTERLNFFITDTGKSSFILGYSWLKKHNPLVDWRTGELCFTRCPTTCQLPSIPSPPPLDPDEEEDLGTLWEQPPTEEEWLCALREELEEGDCLMVIDLNNADDKYPLPEENPNVPPEVLSFLRTVKDNAPCPDKYVKDFSPIFDYNDRIRSVDTDANDNEVPLEYLKDFGPVFTKDAWDRLPPRRKWDHAIELKPGATSVSAKIFPMPNCEQEELDKFLEDKAQNTSPS